MELGGRDILCFSHDWSGDPLSRTHLMRLLARDNRILWVNSIGHRAPRASGRDLRRALTKLRAAAGPVREQEPNIFVLDPVAIPAYGIPGVRGLNHSLLRAQVLPAMRRLGFRRAVNWVANPVAAVVAGSLGEEALIYHCTDEATAFAGVPTRALVALERKLLRRADIVIVSSQRLYESKTRENPRTVLVRHGVDHRHFRRALEPATTVPPEIAGLPRPVIGYFGRMGVDWVDVELLTHVAREFSGGSLVLLGEVTTDLGELAALPNVHLLGRRPYEELPRYCRGFDVALLPFPVSEVTLNANPLKVREYLAAGLPVVSTPIPEVEFLRQCRIGRDRDEFVAEIRAALRQPGPNAERSKSMQSESWDARLDEIRGHLAGLS
jgi:glycosyltransferase involved in cell wall biosynthesis